MPHAAMLKTAAAIVVRVGPWFRPSVSVDRDTDRKTCKVVNGETSDLGRADVWAPIYLFVMFECERPRQYCTAEGHWKFCTRTSVA